MIYMYVYIYIYIGYRDLYVYAFGHLDIDLSNPFMANVPIIFPLGQ